MECKTVLADWLPVTARGMTAYYFDVDGQVYYTIFINAKLCAEAQYFAYAHEMQHILSNDFEKMYEVNNLELRRHCR